MQAKRTSGHFDRITADNERHVVEVVKTTIAEVEKVPRDVINVTGVLRLR